MVNDLDRTRQSAARYLDELADAGMLSKHRIGKHNFYINDQLASLFFEVSSPAEETETVDSAEAG